MRILTGIQPSGTPHLGNYFGAMRQVCELQNRGESFLFIADYHSLTTNPKAQDLRDRVTNLALDFIACGDDLDKTFFSASPPFRKSANLPGSSIPSPRWDFWNVPTATKTRSPKVLLPITDCFPIRY